jgi:hypothetical protein
VWSVYQSVASFRQQRFEIVSRGSLACGILQLPGACEWQEGVGTTSVVGFGMPPTFDADYPFQYSRTIEA